ncbi:hypothetical protein ROZALSC1DRAFT_29818 [Rozella allomycis CSF55]|uniref:BZIP domain-containing protein n=1 Tax=Rozella allomycis (strain CSF55) TaxID=988480 RepID=A0A4P9YGU2_ROZAC|nr:hypothetical protein ROZALSC1DRAFT_29818 [Rozella allomycis CSF55]
MKVIMLKNVSSNDLFSSSNADFRNETVGKSFNEEVLSRSEKNRLAAKRCRDRKKKELESLKETILNQKLEIEYLRHENKRLQDELNDVLKNIMKTHSSNYYRDSIDSQSYLLTGNKNTVFEDYSSKLNMLPKIQNIVPHENYIKHYHRHPNYPYALE